MKKRLLIFIQRYDRAVSKDFGVIPLTYLFFFFFFLEVLVSFHLFDSYTVFDKFQGILRLGQISSTGLLSDVDKLESLLIALGMRFSGEKVR